MTTEFTCGIYTAKYTAYDWNVIVNNTTIGAIGTDGTFFHARGIMLTVDDLIEIAVLMNNVKRQYKQLQTD